MTIFLCVVLTVAVALSVSATRGVSSEATLINVAGITDGEDPVVYDYEIINQFPHDPTAFTQGIQFERLCSKDGDGTCTDIFWESTGMYGASTVREVEVETGTVINSRALPPEYFGEGLAKIEDRIFQLNWLVPTVFIYNESLTLVGQGDTELSDGWGLTTDGESLIATDSGSSLYWLNTESFKTEKEVTVRDNDREVLELNELEWIEEKVWANVWYSNCLAVIEPKNGQVQAWVVLTGLSDIAADAMPPPGQINVLNGIAYDAEKKRVFVTGKYWPLVFEIKVKKRKDVDAVELQKVRQECHPVNFRGF